MYSVKAQESGLGERGDWESLGCSFLVDSMGLNEVTLGEDMTRAEGLGKTDA